MIDFVEMFQCSKNGGIERVWEILWKCSKKDYAKGGRSNVVAQFFSLEHYIYIYIFIRDFPNHMLLDTTR